MKERVTDHMYSAMIFFSAVSERLRLMRSLREDMAAADGQTKDDG